MLERGKLDRGIVEIVDTESLVPKDHLLRKIDLAVDFNRLYEMVEPLYSEDNGRPSVDPVVLFKMVLIQHLYGLPSLQRTADEVGLNVAYRWFLGYTLQEETPHFSTVSYNFRHRFIEDTVNQIFRWILEEAAEAGYLSPKAVFIDGTHIKANANTKKQIKEQVPVASRHYAKELMAEVNADREAHGKKPFDDDDDDPPTAPKKRKDNTFRKKLAHRKKEKKHTVTKSVTGPDSGLFVKGDHKRQFAYEAHTAYDKHGFVLETVVTPGNVHDSVAFDEVYDKVTKAFTEVETIVADSAYKTPHICRKVFGDGRVLSTAYKRPQTKKGGLAVRIEENRNKLKSNIMMFVVAFLFTLALYCTPRMLIEFYWNGAFVPFIRIMKTAAFVFAPLFLAAYMLYISDIKKRIKWTSLNVVWYFSFALYITILIFVLFGGGRRDYDYSAIHPNFTPLVSTIKAIEISIATHDLYFFRSMIFNVLLFAPFSFFLSWKIKKRRAIIGIAFLAICAAELAQQLLNVGVFDIDYILLNLVGVVLGFVSYMCVSKLIKVSSG